MTLQEAKEKKLEAEQKLMRQLFGILRLEGEDRKHAGYLSADEMVKSCKRLIDQHNREMNKLLDSVPE